ncbi:MAG: DJ-1/PfpI family protein [Clostridia bacterium]|nr:DJ-1/PfpI family protein [Clostridia bacterium]
MVYLFLANGFEEIEALCPLDILRRGGVKVTTVGVGAEEIVGSHGIHVLADMRDVFYRDPSPEMVILPGGMPGASNLDASPVVEQAIRAARSSDGYLAAICAAPFVLGKRGLLQGKEAICYPGFEKDLKGATISKKKVVRDGKIITAAGMGVALEFGLELLSALKGEAVAADVKAKILV